MPESWPRTCDRRKTQGHHGTQPQLQLYWDPPRRLPKEGHKPRGTGTCVARDEAKGRDLSAKGRSPVSEASLATFCHPHSGLRLLRRRSHSWEGNKGASLCLTSSFMGRDFEFRRLHFVEKWESFFFSP